MNKDYSQIIQIIREHYGNNKIIPLHAPVFSGNEKTYLNECVDSTYVSSVGKFVDKFENMIAEYTGSARTVAVVNGTNGLHLAMCLAGVAPDTDVITQSLTFVATTNAISYEKAYPIFIDVDIDTMGMSPDSLKRFLEKYAKKTSIGIINQKTGRIISAIVPMHTFGHPVRINEIVAIADEWKIPVVEDAAESLGSWVNGIHTGLIGDVGVISFNGNKTITTGGGGMIITNNEEIGGRAKHLSTTAKVLSRWDFFHDEIGYNYRMPNINAALGCAQMEKLEEILKNKRDTADFYRSKISKNTTGVSFFCEREGTTANYWLQTIILDSRNERDIFLKDTNDDGIQTRPIWILQNKLPMFKNYFCFEQENAQWLEDRVVNIPSGVVK